jgi:hypothetical protein
VLHYLQLFESAQPPDPARDDWAAWIPLLASRASPDGAPHCAMTVVTDGAYGAVSSCLIGLPAQGAPVMKFAAGRPDQTPFAPVPLTPSRRP